MCHQSKPRKGGPWEALVVLAEAGQRERFARLGQIACELDDLVLAISSGAPDDQLLNLAAWVGYLANSVRALDALLDEVEFGAPALRAAA